MTGPNPKNPNMPSSDQGEQIMLPPASAPLHVTRNTSLDTNSVEITLNEATSIIEITAIAKDVIMKYGTDPVTTSDFDEYILAGSTRHYVLPQELTAINVAAIDTGASVIVIEK